MINLIAESLRDNLVKIKSGAILDECQVYKINDDGTTGAPSGSNDDLVIALGITLEAARAAPVQTMCGLTPAQLLMGIKTRSASVVQRNAQIY